MSMAEADDELVDRYHCVGCGVVSPQTETSFTLISARHGWRVIHEVDAQGRQILEWRCPRCWETFRESSRP